jgi:hypothetical protein
MSHDHEQELAPSYSDSQSLRAIGQDLEARHVKAFDLERQNDEYCVRVRKQTPPPESSLPLKLSRSVFRAARLRFREPAPKKENFIASATELRYPPEDIDRLEHEGQARRRNRNGMPDPHSLSQLLRAVGGDINRRAVHLLAISWREESVSIVYRTAEGRRELDNFRLVDSIYDLWVHMYLRRCK